MSCYIHIATFFVSLMTTLSLFAGYEKYVGDGSRQYAADTVAFDDIRGTVDMYTAVSVDDIAEMVYTNAISNAVNVAVRESEERANQKIDDKIAYYIPKNYDQWAKDPENPGNPDFAWDKGSFSWHFYGFWRPEGAWQGEAHDDLIISHSTNGIELIGNTPPGGKTWNYISVWNPAEGERQYLGDVLEKGGDVKYDGTFTNIVISIVTNKQEVTFDTPWKLQSVSDPRVGNVYVKWITEDDPEYMWYQQTGWMVQGDYFMSMPNIDSTDPLATRIVFYNAIENPDTEERIDISGIFVREDASVLGFLLSTDTFTNAVVGVVDKVASERITTEVDNAMKEMLGDNWKTTYGTGLGGILAAILASIVWLKSQIGNAEEALRKL